VYHIFNKWKKPNIHFNNVSKIFLIEKAVKKKTNKEEKLLQVFWKKTCTPNYFWRVLPILCEQLL